ncbi:MAG TPA: hypothetical protein VD997_05990 [Phycisphaerales bacterium]|nr:hypothetical protein [Phycisphaerales bacterium]
MSQFGMQLPGGRVKRGASPDVYTALAALATAFLIAACVVMFMAGKKVGKDGQPWSLQDPTSIKLADVK